MNAKKYAAVFVLPNGRQRTVRFGTASNYVSNPRKTARDRAAYIARHRVNENHGDPLTPGALSRWLLWGESRSLVRNTAAFRRRATSLADPRECPTHSLSTWWSLSTPTSWLPLQTPTRCNLEWRANARPMPARASQGNKLQKKKTTKKL